MLCFTVCKITQHAQHCCVVPPVVMALLAQKSTIVLPNYSQQDATFLDLFILTDALHVSGGSSAHHQEHITVHTASSSIG